MNPGSESFLKPRACLDPQQLLPLPSQRNQVCRAKRSSKPGTKSDLGKKSSENAESSQSGHLHASCHSSSPQPCEQGAFIVILRTQGKEALRSQVTCLKSHSLFLVVPVFRQEPFDLQAWPASFYIQPPYQHHSTQQRITGLKLSPRPEAHAMGLCLHSSRAASQEQSPELIPVQPPTPVPYSPQEKCPPPGHP